jgi:lipopolysaccharide export LptBFGC system permease protein LptF
MDPASSRRRVGAGERVVQGVGSEAAVMRRLRRGLLALLITLCAYLLLLAVLVGVTVAIVKGGIWVVIGMAVVVVIVLAYVFGGLLEDR